MSINRRNFLGGTAATVLVGASRLQAQAASSPVSSAASHALYMPNPTIPHRRGFNLQWERHPGDENVTSISGG